MIEITIHKYISSTIQVWLMLYTSLVILDKKISFNKGLFFAVVYGAWPLLLRYYFNNVLSLPFGIHIFLLIFFHIIIYKLIIDNITWLQCIVGVLVPIILIMIGESIFLLPLMDFLNISFNNLSTLLFAYVAGFTGDIMLLSVILFLKVKRVIIKV